MNFTALFIRRPITTTLIMAGILIFGVLSYISLPVSNLPAVEYPTIEVSAALPGANPDIMASSVATPLEAQFSTIPGLDSMSSSSSLGSTSVTLQFNLSRNIDAAAQDVQAAISQAQGRLPTDMPSPPSFSKVNPADQPILYIAVTSKTMPLSQLDQYAETLMARRMSMISGVAKVNVFGAAKYAVRVQADPLKLAEISLTWKACVARSVQAALICRPERFTGTPKPIPSNQTASLPMPRSSASLLSLIRTAHQFA